MRLLWLPFVAFFLITSIADAYAADKNTVSIPSVSLGKKRTPLKKQGSTNYHPIPPVTKKAVRSSNTSISISLGNKTKLRKRQKSTGYLPLSPSPNLSKKPTFNIPSLRRHDKTQAPVIRKSSFRKPNVQSVGFQPIVSVAIQSRRSPPIPHLVDDSDFDTDTRYVRRELLVELPPKRFTITIKKIGFRVLEVVDLPGLRTEVYRVRTPPSKDVFSAQLQLLKMFPRLLITLNHEVDLSQGLSDFQGLTRKKHFAPRPSRTGSYAREAIGWIGVSKSCGRGVKLGMVDSGVDLTHPALKGQNITYKSFHNPKRRPGPRIHGTTIATLLVGKFGRHGFGGLLPKAELLAANIFEYNARGRKQGNVLGLIKALSWLVRNKVHAINLSIAMGKNKMIQKHVRKIQKQGAVIVAAAGNWGREDRPAYPAAYIQVVAVTAVSKDYRLYKRANRGRYIEFAAPGVGLWTAVPGGGKLQSGTSLATPYVTAVLAVEVARGAGRNIDSLRRRLREGGVADIGPPGWDKFYGWGMLIQQPICS